MSQITKAEGRGPRGTRPQIKRSAARQPFAQTASTLKLLPDWNGSVFMMSQLPPALPQWIFAWSTACWAVGAVPLAMPISLYAPDIESLLAATLTCAAGTGLPGGWPLPRKEPPVPPAHAERTKERERVNS